MRSPSAQGLYLICQEGALPIEILRGLSVWRKGGKGKVGGRHLDCLRAKRGRGASGLVHGTGGTYSRWAPIVPALEKRLPCTLWTGGAAARAVTPPLHDGEGV